MEVSCQLHAPAALPQGKSPWYPLTITEMEMLKNIKYLKLEEVNLLHFTTAIPNFSYLERISPRKFSEGFSYRISTKYIQQVVLEMKHRTYEQDLH
jgi:hypothetical protein